jgi:release factor glutamine methyltransferase
MMQGVNAIRTSLLMDHSVTVVSALAAVCRMFDEVDGRALLRHTLGISDAQLIAHPERILTPMEQQRFEYFAARRAADEPLAYLVGEREFFSRAFKVNSDVLIPRPETELLVEYALEHIPIHQPCRVLDLGTGSGCVAVSIALDRPLARVIAIDFSAAALTVARDNARTHGCTNVEFVCSDWLKPFGIGSFDIVVSNPPYVATNDRYLSNLRFEPALALVSGDDGLDAIRAIIAAAPRYLAEGGWLAFEHGHDQAKCCHMLLTAAGLKDVFSLRDLAGIERIGSGRLRADAVTS